MSRPWRRQNPTSWVVELKKAHKTYVRQEFASPEAAEKRAEKLISLHSLDPLTSLTVDEKRRMMRVDATAYYSPRRRSLSELPFVGGIKVNGTRRGKTC